PRFTTKPLSEFAMPHLHLALHDGFHGDDVVVIVDGIEAVRKSAVTTRHQIGYADSIDLNVPAGDVQITLNIPTRAASGSTSVHVQDATYVEASIDTGGNISYHASEEPFRYL